MNTGCGGQARLFFFGFFFVISLIPNVCKMPLAGPQNNVQDQSELLKEKVFRIAVNGRPRDQSTLPPLCLLQLNPSNKIFLWSSIRKKQDRSGHFLPSDTAHSYFSHGGHMILSSITACEVTAMTLFLYSANLLLSSVQPRVKQWWQEFFT